MKPNEKAGCAVSSSGCLILVFLIPIFLFIVWCLDKLGV